MVWIGLRGVLCDGGVLILGKEGGCSKVLCQPRWKDKAWYLVAVESEVERQADVTSTWAQSSNRGHSPRASSLFSAVDKSVTHEFEILPALKFHISCIDNQKPSPAIKGEAPRGERASHSSDEDDLAICTLPG
ncbi:hypothetical protein TNCT_369051 [Trichonephila clavata]|uniref:Uncharacterized protein n=1 Tax=Trichonephila clavata TaxID=2740835 RepID=A0A8X6ITI0_TRICU|nr:hypothetical protein TNCT_369051 [Trichonephila clavata]